MKRANRFVSRSIRQVEIDLACNADFRGKVLRLYGEGYIPDPPEIDLIITPEGRIRRKSK